MDSQVESIIDRIAKLDRVRQEIALRYIDQLLAKQARKRARTEAKNG